MRGPIIQLEAGAKLFDRLRAKAFGSMQFCIDGTLTPSPALLPLTRLYNVGAALQRKIETLEAAAAAVAAAAAPGRSQTWNQTFMSYTAGRRSGEALVERSA